MLVSFIILIFSYTSSSADNLTQIRKDYYNAVNNEKVAEKFYLDLRARNSSEPIILAYLGSAQAIRAKHAFNPYHKITYLKSGLNTLETAVKASPQNLEIRFLRFSLEQNVPSFLGYSKHLDTDRVKIVELVKHKKFGDMNKPLLVNLLSFMKETKRCSKQEIATLDQAINNG